MFILKIIVLVMIGFGSGVVISGGIFAFIAILGVIPRMAQKTKTEKSMSIYEDCILYGGIFGGITLITPIQFGLGPIGLMLIGLFTGVFVGSVAVSIAEVLDVVPILTRRIYLKKGLVFLMLCLAIGKMTGSLLYYLVQGFYTD
ncbi:MAG: stage V sporulation protein AB [Firmicutes bacterium HGW-Firmicutes-1]|jgi:stage V sporulation protein AB|nr:MAG: stage V sporulation protein AB [Firmicutes bacterium HGW-Firmicutes-1]